MSVEPRRSERRTKGIPPKRLRTDEDDAPVPRKRTKSNGDVDEPSTMDADHHNQAVVGVDPDDDSVDDSRAANPLASVAGHGDNEQLRHILALNKRVIALQREVEESQRARRTLEEQRAEIDKQLENMRLAASSSTVSSGTAAAATTCTIAETATAPKDKPVMRLATTPAEQQTTTANNPFASIDFSCKPTWSASSQQQSVPTWNPAIARCVSSPSTSMCGTNTTNNATSYVANAATSTRPSSSAVCNLPSREHRNASTPTAGGAQIAPNALVGATVRNAGGPLQVADVNRPLHRPATTGGTQIAPNAFVNATQADQGYGHGIQQLHTMAGGAQIVPGSQFCRMQRDADGREYGEMVPVMQAQGYAHVPLGEPYVDDRSSDHTAPGMTIARTYTPRTNPGIYERRRLHDLPTFSGRPEEWPVFVHTYQATTDAYGYTELENLLRLQKALSGEARAAVASMLIMPRNIHQVMNSLELRFGHPSLLVRSQIQLARELPAIDEAHIHQLVAFATNVQNLAAFLDTEATQHHLHNTELLDELLAKLPMTRRIDWASVAMRIVPYPTLKDFAQWLSEIARLINLVAPAEPNTSRSAATGRGGTSKPVQKSKHVFMVKLTNDRAQCAICDAQHDTEQCGEFQRLSTKDRWREVRRLQLCFVCLSHGHMIPSCERKRQCGVDGCKLYHHRSLHQKQNVGVGDSSRTVAEPVRVDNRRGAPQPRSAVCNSIAQSAEQSGEEKEATPAAVNIVKLRERKNIDTLLYKIVPIVLHGRRRSIKTYAFLDDGACVTLMEVALADQLELDGPTSQLIVQWFDGRKTIENSRKVAATISSQPDDGERYDLTCVRTVKQMDLPIQTIDMRELCRSSPHLRGVPVAEYTLARPRILIGVDHHHLGMPLEVRINAERDGLIATKTALGWVVYGSTGAALRRAAVAAHVCVVMHIGDADDRYEELEELVRAYFSTEDFGVKLPSKVIESDESKRARSILDSTTRRVGNRYETGLLWRADDISMPDNYDAAVKRLRAVEQKMERDPQYAALYKAQIEAYVAKGYARKLSDAEARTRSSRTWFLPHFAVMNANKPGKFRMVFDAAAMAYGVSLNSQLLSGPDVNVPLARLLLQFRLGVIGVTADIREMYHQVRIREADRDAQRFLWRDGNSTEEPSVYIMDVMTFGSTCSPASAQHVKNVNATAHEAEFADAADAIRRKHYVDDFVASFDSAEEALRISTDVVEVHSRGGFELRGFASNSQRVVSGLNGETGSGDPVCMQLDESEAEKVLGMCWVTSDDTFTFQTRFHRVRPDVMTGEKTPTKREIMSVSMSVFDPYGFLAPFMLESKIILQDLWRGGIDWDETIPATVEKRWHEWRLEIDRTRLLKEPRCFTPHLRTSTDVQLHVFADASELAFAAVAYIRVVHVNGVDVSFVLGKTRPAPLKLLTIPRLELQAAVLAARMEDEIRRSLDVQFTSATFWSDSQTVLKWLRSDQRKYKQFVAFRVAEILDVAPVSSWRWVPTSMNPADDATRVQRPPKFDPDARWTRGPEWLRLQEDEWPEHALTSAGAVADDVNDDGETRRKFVGIVSSAPETMFERFSRFQRLCRAAAWMRRFVANARLDKGLRNLSGEVSASEVDAAMLALCRWAQRDVYAEEWKALKSGRQLPESSSIYTLKPYADDVGLLRVYGRTDAAEDDVLPHDTRRPILLPRLHRFTMLLVRDHHERMAHQLTNATIAAIRARFWVPQVRVLVRSVQANCLACRKRKVTPLAPVQGQLPKDRLTPYIRPFTSTGLDFFGPVAVTVGRRREKRWIALFTCLATRAVHLEVAADLSADACMTCVRNLCHLRGTPARIRCDNGTNFVGASNELAGESLFLDKDTMQREMSVQGIEWTFNCPGNPEAGGIWERLVQSIKRVLKVTLKEEAPRVETLRAHMLEAANMVNSRPLTHIPVAPGEDTVLTPNHFLIGGPNAVTMTGPTEMEPSHVRKQWRVCRELSRRFWAQWLREYLPELTRRSKNYPEREELKPDDLVVVCEGSQPRGQWPMGRIVSVIRGPDGRVRTAEVRTATGVYRRPVTKLAAFDVGSGSE